MLNLAHYQAMDDISTDAHSVALLPDYQPPVTGTTLSAQHSSTSYQQTVRKMQQYTPDNEQDQLIQFLDPSRILSDCLGTHIPCSSAAFF